MENDRIFEDLKLKHIPKEFETINLCKKLLDISRSEPNIVNIQSPVCVVGDIHGQFSDLLEIFVISGEAPEINYLFLGDYVDRGRYGLETMLYLMLLKLKYPKRITLIRGNHESSLITMVYGFYDECLSKYGTSRVWSCFMSFFETLPLGAMIDDKIFCVHGGISPNALTLDEIRSIGRFCEIPESGAMCDLVWSDPSRSDGWEKSPRGAGYLYGRDVTMKFNSANKIDYICRAHQLVMSGYQWHFGTAAVTIWSAPNYCNRCGNSAAVLQLSEDLSKKFIVFQTYDEESSVWEAQKNIMDYFL